MLLLLLHMLLWLMRWLRHRFVGHYYYGGRGQDGVVHRRSVDHRLRLGKSDLKEPW